MSCDESGNAVSAERSASSVSVDETAVSRPDKIIATRYGANQHGEAPASFGESAQLWVVEVVGNLAKNLAGKRFEARWSGRC